MRNHFRTKDKQETLAQNKINGKSAERYIAATLTSALNARVYWATRTEDDSQVDLICVLTHPWIENRVEVVFTQVKSGKSFCKIDNGNLLVNKSKFDHLTARNHHTLICWTLVDKDTPYWFLIKANSSFFRTEYSNNQLLSPASRFDIVRTLTSVMNKDGGKGLIFTRKNVMHNYDFDSFLNLRNKAKDFYRELKNSEIQNPLFGIIEFTRIGWRHMTRESRLNIFKVASYEIIPILKFLITKTPTKHFNLNTVKKSDETYEYRECEYLLEYENVSCYDLESQQKVRVNIYVKILEFVAYMKDWRVTANASTELERRVIFKSIYYKERSS